MKDLSLALRQLLKSPAFAAVALVSLAFGIGANTAIFSLINAVLLRSLPVPNPHELRVVNWTGRNPTLSNYRGTGSGSRPGGLRYDGSFPYPAYLSFRDRAVGFTEVFAFVPLSEVTTQARGHSSVTGGLMVSGNFFGGYGSGTGLGRPIIPEDDRPGAAPVTVITYAWWERQFGLDPSVIGQTITLNTHSFTVIGVLPRDFVGPLPGDPSDFYVPLATQPLLMPNWPLTSPRHWWVQIMARLDPDSDERQAQASLAVLFEQVLTAAEKTVDQPGIWLQDGSRGPLVQRHRVAQPLWAFLALVALVLVIACANLASLLLARGAEGQHAMAVRAALGASRWQLMRQSLSESLLLAFAGAGLGLLVAAWLKSTLMGLIEFSEGNLHFDTRTDLKVLAFAFGVSIVTAALFGLVPAWRVVRIDPLVSLRDRRALGAPRLRLGKALISVQVGLSAILVVGAGLLTKTFANLSRLDPGFIPEQVLLLRVNAAQTGYPKTQLASLFERTRDSLAAIPGVSAVSFSHLALVGGWESANTVSIPGRQAEAEDRLQAAQLVVNETFFATMGIDWLLGREFTSADTDSSPKVAIVNEAFARSAYPDGHPVGRTFLMGEKAYEVVGVCRDVSYRDLRSGSPPTIYLSHRQAPTDAMFFEVRTVLPPLSLLSAVRNAVASVDSSLPLSLVKTQEQLLDQSIASERLSASLLRALAGLAVLLSCIGLYGLMAYNVARRTGEFGVRMALGARPRQVAGPVVIEAARLAATGWGVGVPVALGLATLARSYLFGIQPYDPLTLIGGAVVMTGVAVLAAWIPARRAARVDPLVALRAE